MNSTFSERTQWWLVVVFAIAMAWLEAAVVFYLRLLTGGNMNPYQPNPFPAHAGIGPAEVLREAATLVMLLMVGGLAGRTWRSRLAYTLIAFGIWDIFYYVFLKVITGWPNSLFDWDILFLIPLPWWGPVIAPVAIALLMILWGTMVTQVETPECPLESGWKAWGLGGIGTALALYVFMMDAVRLVRDGHGVDELRNLLPATFNWPLFLVALLLMACPVLVMLRQLFRQRQLAVNNLETT